MPGQAPPTTQPDSRRGPRPGGRLKAALTVTLGLAAAIVGWQMQASRLPDPDFTYGMKVASPRRIRPVTLQGAAGPVDIPFTDGRWTLVFFGYTHCPDVCPTTLQYLRQEVAAMGAGADRLHVAFVSVDPRRDTPADLDRFARYYHSSFLGLTADKAVIDQLTADAGAAYYPGAKAASGIDYDVSHSTSIYVINPAGQLVALYGGSGKPGMLARDFRFLVP